MENNLSYKCSGHSVEANSNMIGTSKAHPTEVSAKGVQTGTGVIVNEKEKKKRYHAAN